MNKNLLKITVIFIIAAIIIGFFALDFNQYASLGYIKQQQESFKQFYLQNQALTLSAFAIVYIIVAALALPGAAILTILSGALFGVNIGSMIVCPSSTIGATISFLISRFLLRDTINKKFEQKIKVINDGIKKEGAFYLFALRLVPIFPFFMINILMGLTPLRTVTFFVVSLMGMLPGTVLYVYAGTQLARIESVQDILSPNIIIAFVLLGVFPIAAKKALNLLRSKKNEQV